MTESLNRKWIKTITGTKFKELLEIRFNTDTGVSPFIEGDPARIEAFQEAILDVSPDNAIFNSIRDNIKEENLLLVNISSNLRYRPELISYVFYGSEQYYPVILMLNNFESILDFQPSERDNLILLFTPNTLAKII